MYLLKKGFTKEVADKHTKEKERFENWLKEERQTLKQIGYSDILTYTGVWRKHGNKVITMNKKLTALRHYFTYLMGEKRLVHNPALGISLQGTLRTVPYNLLEEEELQDLFTRYPQETLLQIREKAMLGLFVFQGITVKELEQLREENVDLSKGTIYIPSTRRTNSRKLKLESGQILLMYQYLKEVRPKLLKGCTEAIENLFFTTYFNQDLGNVLLRILSHLKLVNTKVKDFIHIRNSVITLWLKRENLRLVQYKAGHRFASSTERYKTNSLEELKNLLEEFHPLG